jgi:two-component sensor histidine kinase
MPRKAPPRQTAAPPTQQTVLAQFGEFALREDDLDRILNEACRLVGTALGTELSKVMERGTDGRTFRVRAGCGWPPGIVGHLTVTAEEDELTARALDTGEAVIEDNLRRSPRPRVAGFVAEQGVVSLVNVPIAGGDGHPPFGLLEVDSRSPRPFTDTDADFLRTYANLLAASIERIRTVGELRSTLADKDRLLRELQHRVKNNLQLVTSFVRLQQRRARSAEARRELLAVGRRIETLNLVYERLYATGDVERVDLGTYLGELGATLLWLHGDEAPGVRLRTDVESLMVRLDRAVPLGLIVNEFVTNSFKHAFKGRAGLIGLEIGRTGDGQAHLRLWDNGAGMLAPRKPGTGLSLIEGFVRQIRAEADWRTDGGTRLAIVFEP